MPFYIQYVIVTFFILIIYNTSTDAQIRRNNYDIWQVENNGTLAEHKKTNCIQNYQYIPIINKCFSKLYLDSVCNSINEKKRNGNDTIMPVVIENNTDHYSISFNNLFTVFFENTDVKIFSITLTYIKPENINTNYFSYLFAFYTIENGFIYIADEGQYDYLGNIWKLTNKVDKRRMSYYKTIISNSLYRRNKGCK